MDWRVTPPKRVTTPTWGPPPPYKQALRLQTGRILRIQVRASSQTKGLEGGWKTESQTGKRRQKRSLCQSVITQKKKTKELHKLILNSRQYSAIAS